MYKVISNKPCKGKFRFPFKFAHEKIYCMEFLVLIQVEYRDPYITGAYKCSEIRKQVVLKNICGRGFIGYFKPSPFSVSVYVPQSQIEWNGEQRSRSYFSWIKYKWIALRRVGVSGIFIGQKMHSRRVFSSRRKMKKFFFGECCITFLSNMILYSTFQKCWPFYKSLIKGMYHLSNFCRYLHHRPLFLGLLNLFFWTWELFL